MVETEPNLAQMVNRGQTDTGVKELETLRSGAVSCSHEVKSRYKPGDPLKGEALCLQGVQARL